MLTALGLDINLINPVDTTQGKCNPLCAIEQPSPPAPGITVLCRSIVVSLDQQVDVRDNHEFLFLR